MNGKEGWLNKKISYRHFFILYFLFLIFYFSYLSCMSQSQSFQAAAWRRLKKNKGAVFGLIIIAIAVLIALFAYFIAPDPSPYANRIILEIGGEKPGFKQSFIKIKKDKDVAAAGFFKQLVSGKEDAYHYVPIISHENKGDSVIVQKFID